VKIISPSEIIKDYKIGNTKNLQVFCIFGIVLSLSVLMYDVYAFTDSTQTTVTRIDDEKRLQKTTLHMNIPETNTLPWGTIKDKIDHPSQGYLVINQIFKSNEDVPIHVAKVNLKGDNSSEYKFRLLSIDEGIITYFLKVIIMSKSSR